MVALLEHVMLDISLPELPRRYATSLLASPPDTASTSLSHLTDSPGVESRRSVLTEGEDDIVLLEPGEQRDSDQKKKLNWIVLSRSDSNIASLSERLSLHSEEDTLSITSITHELNPLARGDSKETLLKFIMRVNKKRETATVGVQTTPEGTLVAHNYQQLHAVSAQLVGEQAVTTSRDQCVTSRDTCVTSRDTCVTSRDQCVTSRDQLQVHCGSNVIVVHSSRDVTTKITCRRVLVLDDDLESKPREFPLSKWRTQGSDNEAQLFLRMNVKPCEPPEFGSAATLHRTSMGDDVTRCDDVTDSDTLYQISCELEAGHLVTSLRDRTLEGLAVFLEPDPSLPVTPLTLACTVRDCRVVLRVGATLQTLHVQGVKVRLKEDETWEIGEVGGDGLEVERLRKENEELREKLTLLMSTVNH